MTRLRWVPALAVLVSAMAACSGSAQTLYPRDGHAFSPEVASPPPVEWEIDPEAPEAERLAMLEAELRSRIEASTATGGMLVVVHDGRTALATGLGSEDADPGSAPVDADTRFLLASVSKIFTALAGLIGAERGEWDLDAPIREHIEGVDERITLRLALSHRAGLRDYLSCSEGLTTPTEWARARAGDPLWSPPGVLFNYSNPGFALAAATYEHASGRALDALVDEWVFAPMGLRAATYQPFDDPRTLEGAHVAAPQGAIPLGHNALECGVLQAAGGVWMNADDMGRALLALLGRAPVFSDAVLRELTTPLVSIHDGGRARYGQGMFFEDLVAADGTEHRVAYHLGGTPWYEAGLLLIPEEGFAVAYAVNGPGVHPVIFDAVSLFFGWERAPEEPPTDVTRFAGVWRDPEGDLGRFRVEAAGDRLVLTPLGGQRVWPIPVGGTFWLDATGRPMYFATRRGVATPE